MTAARVPYFLFALLAGCASPLSTATGTVNDARAVLDVAHDMITDTCVPAYDHAASAEQLAEADEKCKPAREAYDVARAAWTEAAFAVLAAKSGAPVDLTVTGAKLSAAVAALAHPMKAVRK